MVCFWEEKGRESCIIIHLLFIIFNYLMNVFCKKTAIIDLRNFAASEKCEID